MNRISEVKLGKAPKQEALVESTLDSLRRLYNQALEDRKTSWEKEHKGLTLYDQQKAFTKVRKLDPIIWALNVVMVRATVFRRLDLAFKSFFRRVQAGETPGYPRFKGKDRFRTIVFGDQGWKLNDKKLTLTGIPGNPTFRLKGKIHRKGFIKGLRIVRKADRYFAQFIVDCGEAPDLVPSKNIVGIDIGLKSFATLSTGEVIDNPRFLKKSFGQLKKAQRRLSSKQKGSNRRAKAKKELARLHTKVANRRTDFVRQTVASLVKHYEAFAIEDLDIQGMLEKDPKDDPKKRGLHRGIMDAAWGQFGFHLACKAEEAGKLVIRVNPKGTTQRCSQCGTVVRKDLSVRTHDCPACGLIIDRDLNASLNIEKLGLSQTTSDQGWQGSIGSSAESFRKLGVQKPLNPLGTF